MEYFDIDFLTLNDKKGHLSISTETKPTQILNKKEERWIHVVFKQITKDEKKLAKKIHTKHILKP